MNTNELSYAYNMQYPYELSYVHGIMTQLLNKEYK